MKRIEKLAACVRELQLDALMLTSEVNMYYAAKFPRLEGMVIVMADGTGVCYTDSRYIEAATEQMSPMGYQVIEPAGSYPTPETIKDFVLKNGIRRLGVEDERMSLAVFRIYESLLPCELVPLGNTIEEIRREKEPWEIEQILAAQKIAEESLKRIMPDLKPGAFEDELVAKLRWHMAMLGSEDFAPGMILVCGKTTSMPHGQPGHRQISEGDFVTIDFGAMVNGYNSDMTRTFAIGKASPKMKEVYGIVLEAQLAGIDAFAAGKKGMEVDAAARSVIEKAGYGRYFGHGLGHSLGLEIHENPRANRTYSGVYKENDITTIEPGIYIPGEFGVRIEDMIWLGSNGKQNLTAFPKELMII